MNPSLRRMMLQLLVLKVKPIATIEFGQKYMLSSIRTLAVTRDFDLRLFLVHVLSYLLG